MIILGVDPGSRRTGYGAISMEGDRLRCIECGVITPAQHGKPPALPERLLIIHNQLESLIQRISPEIVAVEEIFYAANAKSALTLGHVRGVVLLAASRLGVQLKEYAPLEVKKAVVGYGRADKKQVQAMVKVLLNLKREPEPHDAADALAIALCHSFSSSMPKHRQGRWRSYRPVAR